MTAAAGVGAHLRITYHFLELFLLAHLHHDQSLLHQAQPHVPLGVSKLQGDVGTAGTQVFHVEQALSVLDIPHHAVHGISPSILLERGHTRVSGRGTLSKGWPWGPQVLFADLRESLPSRCP